MNRRDTVLALLALGAVPRTSIAQSQGKVWRIGLMGYSSRQTNVLVFLAALEQILAGLGHKFQHGSAVAA